jgi:hypothetical protein
VTLIAATKKEKTGDCRRKAHSLDQRADSVQPCTLPERLLILVGQLLYLRFRAQRLLHALLNEYYSLGGRIQIAHRNRLAKAGVDFGPSFELDGHERLVRCRRTHACIRDIKNLQKQHSWLSLSDLYLCQKIWVAGWESHASHVTYSDTQSQIHGHS